MDIVEVTPQGPLTRTEEREALVTAVLVYGNRTLAPVVADLIRKRWVDHPWAHRKTLHLEDSSDLTGL